MGRDDVVGLHKALLGNLPVAMQSLGDMGLDVSLV